MFSTGKFLFSSFPGHGQILTVQIATTSVPPDVTRFVTFGYYELDEKSITWWRNVSTPSAVRAWHRQSADGRWWQMINTQWTPQVFGAKADNNGARGNGTDDTTALRDFFDACAVLGGEGYIPAGSYRVSSRLVWDAGKQTNLRAAYLPTIKGAGVSSSTLMFDSSVSSPCFQISNITGRVAEDGQKAIFYGEVSGFSVETSCDNGIGLLFGGKDPLANTGAEVYFNGTVIGPIGVANRAQTSDSIGVLTSGLTTCWVNIVSNCGGVPASHGGGAADFYGIAHQVQHCSMTSFHGALGNARIGTYVKSGGCFGNAWNTIDWEVLGTCFKAESPQFSGNSTNSGMNKILGGVMTLCDYAFDVTSGQGLESEGVLIGDVRLSIIKNVDSDVVGVYGGYGLVLRRPNQKMIGKVRNGNYWNSNVSHPPGPGSATTAQPTLTRGSWIKNRWGQAATVYVYSNDHALPTTVIEIFKRDWDDFSGSGRRIGIGPLAMMPIRLEPGQSMMIPGSSAAVSWFWEPAE